MKVSKILIGLALLASLKMQASYTKRLSIHANYIKKASILAATAGSVYYFNNVLPQNIDRLKTTRECRGCAFMFGDLSNIDVRYVDARRAKFHFANLSKANFRGADLEGAQGLDAAIYSKCPDSGPRFREADRDQYSSNEIASLLRRGISVCEKPVIVKKFNQ